MSRIIAAGCQGPNGGSFLGGGRERIKVPNGLASNLLYATRSLETATGTYEPFMSSSSARDVLPLTNCLFVATRTNKFVRFGCTSSSSSHAFITCCIPSSISTATSSLFPHNAVVSESRGRAPLLEVLDAALESLVIPNTLRRIAGVSRRLFLKPGGEVSLVEV